MGVLENRDLWVQIAELIATIAQGGGGGGSGVQDVKVNNVSVVSDGVANIAPATGVSFGVVTVTDGTYGLSVNNGNVRVYPASSGLIKGGTESNTPVTPVRQHLAVFYGLAKASGDATQSASNNPVGQYTDDAKQSIKEMLGITCLIPVTYDDVEDTYTSDYSYADISDLISKGCYCVAVLNDEYYNLGAVDTTNSEIVFYNIKIDSTDGVTSNTLLFTTSGVSYDFTTYPDSNGGL